MPMDLQVLYNFFDPGQILYKITLQQSSSLCNEFKMKILVLFPDYRLHSTLLST